MRIRYVTDTPEGFLLRIGNGNLVERFPVDLDGRSWTGAWEGGRGGGKVRPTDLPPAGSKRAATTFIGTRKVFQLL